MDFNGLKVAMPGLAAEHYFDPAMHAADLRKIWRRHWVYACRSEDLAAARSFVTFEIGDQPVLLVRTDAGGVNGFFNTCRHRGAALCAEPAGMLKAASIVCPYHAWVYDFDGRLVRTSSKSQAAGFDPDDYPLYPVRVTEWNGCVFVALCADPPDFASSFDQPLSRLDDWRLQDMRVGHVFTKIVNCNWKIFWENYNECLHCPGVHPELSRLVPLFGRGLLEERDDPRWSEHAGDNDPRFKGGLRAGASTWSRDGGPIGPKIGGIKDEDRNAAHIYMTSLPSMFIVGHPDYARVVRLRPLGPERTEMRVEYLFPAATLADRSAEIGKAVEFANGVMSEDAAVCELNQKGLHAAPHRRGVLMPEEYLVASFQEWVRRELAGNPE